MSTHLVELRLCLLARLKKRRVIESKVIVVGIHGALLPNTLTLATLDKTPPLRAAPSHTTAQSWPVIFQEDSNLIQPSHCHAPLASGVCLSGVWLVWHSAAEHIAWLGDPGFCGHVSVKCTLRAGHSTGAWLTCGWERPGLRAHHSCARAVSFNTRRLSQRPNVVTTLWNSCVAPWLTMGLAMRREMSSLV